MSDLIRLEQDAGIATIHLNRPRALNALNQELADALAEALARVERDPALRVVVLRGEGAFMAGGDVRGFAEAAAQGPAAIRQSVEKLIPVAHRCIQTMAKMPQPVVASVERAAAGIGLSFVLAADLAIAAEGTRFTLAYASIGTSPDGSSTWNLPRLVGTKKAAELALLSPTFDAAEAQRLGLVNFVVPADRLAAETRALAERLATGPARALQATKRLLRASFENGLTEQLRREQESFVACAVTPDFREGTAAFVEKRRPEFEKP